MKPTSHSAQAVRSEQDRARRDNAPSGASKPALDETERCSAEWDLVLRIQNGDRDAFAELYETYRPNVRRFIMSRVDDASEAEDLMQETFIQAYRSIQQFEGRSRLLTWLLGIARFVTLRFHRFADRWMVGAGASQLVVEPASDTRHEQRLEALLALDSCHQIISRVSSQESQTIFELRYGKAKSVREIAAEVGKSTHAVKASLRRSRVAIQQRLAHEGKALMTVAPLRVAKAQPLRERAPLALAVNSA